MPHPLFLIEQAVRQFSSQWCAGLRPSLEIQTKYDGSVVVNSKMFCSNSSQSKSSASIFPFTSTPRSKRAKKNARYRRNKTSKMKGLIPTANVETQFSINDAALSSSETENVDSGFNNDSNISNTDTATTFNTSYNGNHSNKAEGPAPQVISAGEENVDLEDSVTTSYLDDALLNSSSTARHNSESYPKEVVASLEQYPEHSLVENCYEAQDTLDITIVNNGPNEVRKVFTKKRKIKKPLEYSNDDQFKNWHERWVGFFCEFNCAYCKLNSASENWKQLSEVACFSKENGGPTCKTCRRTGSMYFLSSKHR